MNVLIEVKDGEYIGIIEDFWFIENGNSEEEVIYKLAESLKEFAIDYNNDLKLYKTTPNFNDMFTKLKGVIENDVSSIIDTFEIKVKYKRD